MFDIMMIVVIIILQWLNVASALQPANYSAIIKHIHTHLSNVNDVLCLNLSEVT